jgi:flavin reductase (DIM6/NTAB) family NADH-FMN oxidoreductase RutF
VVKTSCYNKGYLISAADVRLRISTPIHEREYERSQVMVDDAFSSVMAALDAPLIVVTTSEGGERAGCLVGFHTQSSIDPRRYSVWLSKANHTYRVALRSDHLGIHFLSTHDFALAERFGTLTGDDVDKFDGLRLEQGPGAVPVLVDCANRLVVRRTALLDEGGDHVCMIGEAVRVSSGDALQPLRLSHAAGLQPGHAIEERNSPPTERATHEAEAVGPHSGVAEEGAL